MFSKLKFPSHWERGRIMDQNWTNFLLPMAIRSFSLDNLTVLVDIQGLKYLTNENLFYLLFYRNFVLDKKSCTIPNLKYAISDLNTHFSNYTGYDQKIEKQNALIFLKMTLIFVIFPFDSSKV